MRFSKTWAIAATALLSCSVVLGARLQRTAVECMDDAHHTVPFGQVRKQLREDIGEEVTLEVSLAFTDNVIDPATNAFVRPVSLHASFEHRGIVEMAELSSLLLRPVDSTEAWSVFVGGLDRNLLEERDPPLPALYYSLTIVPKQGLTWGTIRGTTDLDISAVERRPGDFNPAGTSSER